MKVLQLVFQPLTSTLFVLWCYPGPLLRNTVYTMGLESQLSTLLSAHHPDRLTHQHIYVLRSKILKLYTLIFTDLSPNSQIKYMRNLLQIFLAEYLYKPLGRVVISRLLICLVFTVLL